MDLPECFQEQQYLDLCRDLLKNGERTSNRTGVDTLSVFGRMMRFDLTKGFPLLTTKNVYWKGIVRELLWFIRGQTDAKILSDQGVTIWNGNGSREFLDKRGLNYETGDLGPVYGFQWRHFGAEYVSSSSDYTGKGVDQLKECIHLIKNDPQSRRIILTAWNPSDLNKMALPPCHVMCQFRIHNNKLSCMMTQRSCDVGLGVPFNIASYALLTHILAKICKLGVGEFVYSMGDVHIYTNHIEAIQEQLLRTPRLLPQLQIKDISSIDAIQESDIVLLNYDPHPKIKMEMIV